MLVDLHIHARKSPLHRVTRRRAEQILLKAVHEGLQAIAVVDHNSLKGPLFVARVQQESALPIVVIPGFELTTLWRGRPHHLLGLQVSSCLMPCCSMRKAIEGIREQGGSAILPHPSGKVLREFCADLDGFEVVNGRHPVRAPESLCAAEKTIHLLRTGGSDAHTIEEIGKVKFLASRADLIEKGLLR